MLDGTFFKEHLETEHSDFKYYDAHIMALSLNTLQLCDMNRCRYITYVAASPSQAQSVSNARDGLTAGHAVNGKHRLPSKYRCSNRNITLQLSSFKPMKVGPRAISVRFEALHTYP